MTTNQPLSLFISSKMAELPTERRAVQKALAAYRMYGWLWEKNAGARPEPIRSAYLKEVESCDIYVGLFWQGYGEYTIEEYQHARTHHKPCLIYEKNVDVEQRDQQLTDFLKGINRVTASDGLTVCRFKTAEELAEQVQEDVIRLLTSRFRDIRQQPIWNIPYPVASTDLSASPSGDVIILTALPAEFRAVVAHLQRTQEVVHPETGPSGNASTLEQKPLPEEFLAKHEAHQEPTDLTFTEGLFHVPVHNLPKATKDEKRPIYKRKNRNLRKRRLLVSVAILLALALSLVRFIPFPACSAAFCHPSQQSPNQQLTPNTGEVQDQNLSVRLINVVSPSFVLPDDPNRYSGRNPLPMSICAVLIAKNTSIPYKIIVDVQNLLHEHDYILIEDVALKILATPELPGPINVWTQGTSTTYNVAYPYPVPYDGQTFGQFLHALPSQKVSLKPRESDPLSIQVSSKLMVSLHFQVQISYETTNPYTGIHTLTLPQIFQVVFLKVPYWHEYILQNGSFVRKS
ncbi:MAG: DUF4062 domain-containing protein [Ktedonobacteraceae bacterium]